VLQLNQFGIHDSLFDLGADSLQVFQIVARANDAGLKVTPKQILSGRTIAAICDELDRAALATPQADGPQLVAVARDRFRRQRSELGARDGSNA
jgi:aryl carrier-like protein